jgi:hypothetical protein
MDISPEPQLRRSFTRIHHGRVQVALVSRLGSKAPHFQSSRDRGPGPGPGHAERPHGTTTPRASRPPTPYCQMVLAENCESGVGLDDPGSPLVLQSTVFPLCRQ